MLINRYGLAHESKDSLAARITRFAESVGATIDTAHIQDIAATIKESEPRGCFPFRWRRDA